MNPKSPVPPVVRPTAPISTAHLLVVALLLAVPVSVFSQLTTFPIADQGAVMGCSYDGSNFLIGVENHLTSPTTIGGQMVGPGGTKVGNYIPTGRSGISTTVAFDGTQYLLIWEDDGLGTLNGTTGWQVYGQFISKAGTVVGPPFAVSTAGIWFDAIRPMAFGGGKYLITYTRLIIPAHGAEFNNRYIAGRLMGPDGTLGDEFRISSGYGDASEVAFGSNGFFVVWREDYGDAEIRGRFVSAAGLLGTEISVNASPAPSDNPKAVAFDGTNFLVVWNDEVGGAGSFTWDCFGQLVSPAGSLVGGQITITAEPGAQLPTSLAFDGTRYLAVWVDMSVPDNWNCFGQFINPSGSLFGDKFPISTDAGNQMCGVGFAGGKYMLVVNNGILMGNGGISQINSSFGMFLDPPANPKIQTDSGFGVQGDRFGFTITGFTNAAVVVEASTNLLSSGWVPLQTNRLSGGSSYFSDPLWRSYPRRFYRLGAP